MSREALEQMVHEQLGRPPFPPLIDAIVDFVSDWMIAVATMENGECVTDLEAQWAEEMSNETG